MADEDEDDDFRWAPTARDRLEELREVQAAERNAGWKRNLMGLLALLLVGWLFYLYALR